MPLLLSAAKIFMAIIHQQDSCRENSVCSPALNELTFHEARVFIDELLRVSGSFFRQQWRQAESTQLNTQTKGLGSLLFTWKSSGENVWASTVAAITQWFQWEIDSSEKKIQKTQWAIIQYRTELFHNKQHVGLHSTNNERVLDRLQGHKRLFNKHLERQREAIYVQSTRTNLSALPSAVYFKKS